MGCCELVRQARRNGSQQVVAARRRAQQQQQPCALQVLERGQAGEQLLVLVPLRCQDSRNELPASNRAAQHDQILFSRRQGPASRPAGRLALRRRQRCQKPRGLFASCVPGASFPKVYLDVGEAGQRRLRGSQGRKCALRKGCDVNIVQKRIQSFPRVKLGVQVEEGGVLAERIKPRHEGVSLLPALSLQHFVPHTCLVVVGVTAGLPIEQGGERQQAGKGSMCPKRLEHARAGDVVVGPHAVDAQHCHSGVGLDRRLHCADDGLGACARAARVLERRACCAERGPKLPRQRPGHQATKDVTHDQGSHSIMASLAQPCGLVAARPQRRLEPSPLPACPLHAPGAQP